MTSRPWLLAIALCGCTHAATPGGGGPDAWVDPKLGTDDPQHGGAPGTSAFRTITYALQHASAIHLASGTYDAASGETFPIVLTGEQALLGQPDLSSHIAGNAPQDPSIGTSYTAIALAGTANAVVSCDVTPTAANRPMYPACIRITTSGAHLVDSSSLHDCSIAIDFEGASGVTIRDTTSGDVDHVAVNCLNGVGNDVYVANFSCYAQNDWIYGCGANFTGCGTVEHGRNANCSVDAAALSAPCQ